MCAQMFRVSPRTCDKLDLSWRTGWFNVLSFLGTGILQLVVDSLSANRAAVAIFVVLQRQSLVLPPKRRHSPKRQHLPVFPPLVLQCGGASLVSRRPYAAIQRQSPAFPPLTPATISPFTINKKGAPFTIRPAFFTPLYLCGFALPFYLLNFHRECHVSAGGVRVGTARVRLDRHRVSSVLLCGFRQVDVILGLGVIHLQ
jgi:hypothetical protein